MTDQQRAVVILNTLLTVSLMTCHAVNWTNSKDNSIDTTPLKDFQRPAHWAIALEIPGIPNVYKVSDDLYRGARPTPVGMQALKDLGMKTIISLRAFHSDAEEFRKIGVEYAHIPMLGIYPLQSDILQFLHIVMNSEKIPVFVHCRHGADRTGLMSAIYRMIVQDWTKTEAIQEMIAGGFGFHHVLKNLIWYLEELDIEVIKRERARIWPQESKS